VVAQRAYPIPGGAENQHVLANPPIPHYPKLSELSHTEVHVSFCACRWRDEIVIGRIPDSSVMWDGFGGLESGIAPIEMRMSSHLGRSRIVCAILARRWNVFF
jgi:hypothetical protein